MSALNQIVASFKYAAASSFPLVLDITNTSATPYGTVHSINMPSTVASGDLLLITAAFNDGYTPSVPSGWSVLFSDIFGTVPVFSYYKQANGTEGGTTVTITTSGSQQLSAQVTRIAAASYSGIPEVSARAQPSGLAPDPPALTPSWGARNTLWAAVLGTTADSVSTYPLPDNNSITVSGGAPKSALCYTSANTATLDPVAYTLSGTLPSNTVYTVAIRPA